MTHATTSAMSGDLFYRTIRSKLRNPWVAWGLYGISLAISSNQSTGRMWTSAVTYGWLDENWRTER